MRPRACPSLSSSRLFPCLCYTHRLLIMHIFLLIICTGLFLGLFQSTRDGFLWLIAVGLSLSILLLVFTTAP